MSYPYDVQGLGYALVALYLSGSCYEMEARYLIYFYGPIPRRLLGFLARGRARCSRLYGAAGTLWSAMRLNSFLLVGLSVPVVHTVLHTMQAEAEADWAMLVQHVEASSQISAEAKHDAANAFLTRVRDIGGARDQVGHLSLSFE